MQGYPTVQILLPGTLLMEPQQSLQGYLGGDQSGAQSPPIVPIQPGSTVSALLEWENFPQSGASTPTAQNCTGYGSTTLMVNVPGGDNSQQLTVPPDVCWGFYVHPVVPVVANTWQ